MKKKIKVGLSVGIILLLITSGIGLLNISNNKAEAGSISKLSVAERSAKAKDTLIQLSKQPDQRNIALVSFNNLNDPEAIKKVVGKYNLSVERLYHAYPANKNIFRGGYINKKNAPLDQALASYSDEIKGGIQSNIKTLKQKLAVMESKTDSNINDKDREDQRSMEAMKILLADFESQFADMNANGLRIYGAQISGVNTDLIKLSGDLNVSLVEVLNKSDRKAIPIFPAR